ncbi:MAG TPA: SGNH/GDSL hydrolase family protein [Chthoniobacterales bacterium]
MLLKPNDHILFYGDSITDCGRNRTAVPDADDGLGNGYVRLAHARLQADFPRLNLRTTNRGISGDRVYDLESRLQQDVLDLKPTVVSILIGINDTWRRYDSAKLISSPEEFGASYRRILEKLAKELAAKVVILEPFLLPVPEDRREWREDLDPRIHVVRDLAVEFGAHYLPLDGLFAQASARRSAPFWLPDGVHPSAAGHGLIADAWVRLVS